MACSTDAAGPPTGRTSTSSPDSSARPGPPAAPAGSTRARWSPPAGSRPASPAPCTWWTGSPDGGLRSPPPASSTTTGARTGQEPSRAEPAGPERDDRPGPRCALVVAVPGKADDGEGLLAGREVRVHHEEQVSRPGDRGGAPKGRVRAHELDLGARGVAPQLEERDLGGRATLDDDEPPVGDQHAV